MLHFNYPVFAVEAPKAEDQLHPSESAETKDVTEANPKPELELDLKPEVKEEPSSPRCTTVPSHIEAEAKNTSESLSEPSSAQSESPHKPEHDDNTEDIAGEGEAVVIKGEKSLPEEDAEGFVRSEGVMNASQFLQMAEAAAAVKEESEIIQGVDSNAEEDEEEDDESVSEEEDEPFEDDEFEEQPLVKKNKSQKSAVDVKMESTAGDEPMDDNEDVNGSVDKYPGQEYREDMEGEPSEKDHSENVSDMKPSLKSESDEKQGNSKEDGNSKQGGSETKKKLRRQKRKILKDDETDESEEERKKKRKKRKKKGVLCNSLISVGSIRAPAVCIQSIYFSNKMFSVYPTAKVLS